MRQAPASSFAPAASFPQQADFVRPYKGVPTSTRRWTMEKKTKPAETLKAKIRPWDRLQDILPPLSTHEFKELTKSIKQRGVLQPMLVLSDGRIIPIWVQLENPEGIRLEKEPQILSESRLISLYFDVISKATCSVELVFPDAFEPRMKKMLSQLESLNVFNRRRASAKVLEKEPVEENP